MFNNFMKAFNRAPGVGKAAMTIAMFMALEQGVAAAGNDTTSLGQQAHGTYDKLDALDKEGYSIKNDGKKVFENKGNERVYTVLNNKGGADYFLVDLDNDGNIDKMRFVDGEIDFKNDPNYQPGGKNFGVRVNAQVKYSEGLQLVLNVEKHKEEKALAEKAEAAKGASVSVDPSVTF